MDLVVDSNVKNDLVGRSEIRGNVVFDSSTPSRMDVKKLVSSNLKVDESLVIVRTVGTVFGGRSASFCAFVYDDEAKLSLFEQKYMIKRNSEKKDEKKDDGKGVEKKDEGSGSSGSKVDESKKDAEKKDKDSGSSESKVDDSKGAEKKSESSDSSGPKVDEGKDEDKKDEGSGSSESKVDEGKDEDKKDEGSGSEGGA